MTTTAAKSTTITEENLLGLPDPVQRHLRQAGVPGTPWITEVTVEQEGVFRLAPEREYAPITARQTYRVDRPEFEWKARLKMSPVMTVRGVDRLTNGEGFMQMRLYGIIPVMTARGEKLNQGALTRYLSEMIWFPQAFLADFISWEAIDEHHAKAILTAPTMAVSGIFEFDDEGRFVTFTTERYYNDGEKDCMLPWNTPAASYGELGGLQLPVRGKAIWTFEDGSEFEYIDITITKIEYR